MPFVENRTVWPHADPVAAADHLADHNAIAAALNAGVAPLPHSHIDADLPAGLARDAEVAAAYAGLTHTHAVPAVGVLRKTGAQTMTLTSQAAVTDMAFPVAANSTYYFQMECIITTSMGTSPTTAWGFTGPTSPTAVAITMTQDTSTSIQAVAVLTAFGNFAAGAQVANTGAKFTGVVQTGANAGTVALTAARAGTTPSMVVAAGCTGLWVKAA